MESAKTIQYIPEEIIIQILQRLTVLPLLKFRCVCKLWFSLISSSTFQKTHLNHSKNSQNYANHHLILAPSRYYSEPSFSCSLASIFDETAPSNLKPLNMQDSAGIRMRIFGHCNGLLCVSVNAELLLYNPTTRKSKKLPALVNDLKTYGFCYNESIDDYKVVELMNLGPLFSIKHDGGVSIFSLRTQSWMKRMSGGCFRNLSNPGLPIGGVVYWKNNSRRQIVAVDTLTCTYGTLELPNFDVLPGILSSDIMEFGGGLGVYRYVFRTSVEIWTMKTSWTKVLFIPYGGSPKGTRIPLLGLKDAHILFYNGRGRLMVYNSRENSYAYRRIRNDTRELNVNRFVRSPVYIESLIEPSFDQESPVA